jgi:hypothetical protein
MGIKETFEGHPVVWGLGLLVAGFVAGFAARAYFLSPSVRTVSCIVEGLEGMENAHSKSIETLNSQLVAVEAKAADHNLINFYQEQYKASADRLRQDIDNANGVYLSAVESLRKRCE